MTNFHSFT